MTETASQGDGKVTLGYFTRLEELSVPSVEPVGSYSLWSERDQGSLPVQHRNNKNQNLNLLVRRETEIKPARLLGGHSLFALSVSFSK